MALAQILEFCIPLANPLSTCHPPGFFLPLYCCLCIMKLFDLSMLNGIHLVSSLCDGMLGGAEALVGFSQYTLFLRFVTILPVRGQAANRRTGRSEFEFRGRALSWCHVMKSTNQVLPYSIYIGVIPCHVMLCTCSSPFLNDMIDPWNSQIQTVIQTICKTSLGQLQAASDMPGQALAQAGLQRAWACIQKG